ncbi:MAG: ACT domain-containing protein [Ilumatobacter sp.]|nr:ACT domain-containing protein [Ilumatobacter sp.]
MTTLVLTVIGHDRAGLVDALAGPIAEHGGSWDHSHLARLAGQFAGIVVVTVPESTVDALTSSFETFKAQGLLDVRVAIASTDDDALSDDAALVELQLVGQDRPGIVREIAGALAARGVSIEELETARSSAPMSAEQLFEVNALLRVPTELPFEQLQDTLEDIANELMVDLDLRLTEE